MSQVQQTNICDKCGGQRTFYAEIPATMSNGYTYAVHGVTASSIKICMCTPMPIHPLVDANYINTSIEFADMPVLHDAIRKIVQEELAAREDALVDKIMQRIGQQLRMQSGRK